MHRRMVCWCMNSGAARGGHFVQDDNNSKWSRRVRLIVLCWHYPGPLLTAFFWLLSWPRCVVGELIQASELCNMTLYTCSKLLGSLQFLTCQYGIFGWAFQAEQRFIYCDTQDFRFVGGGQLVTIEVQVHHW